MARFYRECDYVIDTGEYNHKNITFVRAERLSKRNIDTNRQYLHTCFSANSVFTQNDGQAIIPQCQPCSEFSVERNVKKSLLGKTQFSPKIAKRFQCKWLLRQNIQISQSEHNNTSRQEQSEPTRDKTTTTDSLPKIEIMKNKRKRLTHNENIERTKVLHDRKIKDLEIKIQQLTSSMKEVEEQKSKLMEENFELNAVLCESAEKLKQQNIRFDTNRSTTSLTDAVENVVLSRYSSNYAKSTIAKEFWRNVVTHDSFLEGECAAIYKSKTS